MVQKYQSPVRVYKYPFELVMLAYERRFPVCPQMPIVLDCQIVKEDCSDDGAVRNTSRRCKLAVDAPYLFKKLIGLDVVYFVQTNFLDLRSRSLNIEAVNETYSSRIEIFERCRYYAHPENADWTCFDQTATLDIKNFFGFENSMEKMGMKQYTQTTLKGKEIIEYFIEELRKDGITTVERWQEPPPTISPIHIPSSSTTICDTSIVGGGGGGGGPEIPSCTNDIIDNNNLPNENTNTVNNCTNNDNHLENSNDISNDLSTTSAQQKQSNEQSQTNEPEQLSNILSTTATEVTAAISTSPSTSRKPSMNEYEEMLIADYITKNLGELEPLQESKLLELRKSIKELYPDKYSKISYETLLRFLRARDFNVEKAVQMLDESIKWRDHNRIDELLMDYKIPAIIDRYFPGAWHHANDKIGRPIYILRLGHMDVKGILKAIGEDGLLKLTLHICEEGLQLIERATKQLQKPVTSWCILVDLDGLSMRHLWRPGVKALFRIIQTVELNYPETMGRVFIVRAPRVFPIAWTIVSAFIDENTRSKFLFYGGPDCIHMKDGLEQYIDSDSIPDFLGGPSKTLIHEGGLVPKTIYKTISEDNGDGGGTTSMPQSPTELSAPPITTAVMTRISDSIGTTPITTTSNLSISSSTRSVQNLNIIGGLSSIMIGGASGSSGVDLNQHNNSHHGLYKSIDLRPGHIHEIVIINNDPKSVLTWDFDVVKSDLHFTVYRTTKSISHLNDPSVSVFDLSGFVEDKNYFRAEPTLVCRHKESVQGSHVMTNCGNYILQWFCPPSCDSPAQLMYFHEILSSANYKGSMSSLQSGISAISSISCLSR